MHIAPNIQVLQIRTPIEDVGAIHCNTAIGIIVHCGETGAILESIIAHKGDRRRNCDRRDKWTPIESTVRYSGDIVTDVDGGHITASAPTRTSDGDAIGGIEIDGGQTGAVGESIVFNISNRIGDGDWRDITTTNECIIRYPNYVTSNINGCWYGEK